VTDVVLDASVAAIALVESTARGREVRGRLDGVVVHAPHLIDAEVGSVLRRRTASGAIPAARASRAFRVLSSLVTERYSHGPLAIDAWALRENLTFYDALYAALAARLGLPLLTADARLARAPRLPCAVELVG
jgi:predicted nucleic acid-binding protein